MAQRHCLENAATLVWRGHELIEQVQRRLVHAGRGNLLGRKYVRIQCAVRDGCVPAPKSAQASTPVVQNGGIIECPSKCTVAPLRKIRERLACGGPLEGRWHRDS